MTVFQVSTQDYKVMASIMKDGIGMRHPFTFKELLCTLQNVGFSVAAKGRLIYDGKVLFAFKPKDKGRAAVSYARQDELKQQMVAVFGWTKGTFVERPEL